ncbi:MAG: sigma factor-like helix-turn-helix DNA-binding protein, partial [Sphingopyxis sp.]
LWAVVQPEPPDNRLRQCLERLPAYQASAITTMYTYGMSHSELADHLGQPLGTVKSWVRRGTTSLRQCMDADGGGLCSIDTLPTPRHVDAYK